MTNEQALARARKDVCRTELDHCHARNRNATQGEMDGLKRKLEYKKYIMEAVEVKKEKNCLLSYSDLEKMHGKPVFCVWPPNEYRSAMTRWGLVCVNHLRNEIMIVNDHGMKATWAELLESDVAFYRYEE